MVEFQRAKIERGEDLFICHFIVESIMHDFKVHIMIRPLEWEIRDAE
jgi:hypothetical protein